MIDVQDGQVAAFEGLVIGGELVPAGDGLEADVHDPTNGSVLTRVAEAGGEDVERAVRAAQAAFDPQGPWRRMSSRERGQLLRRIADGLREKAAHSAQLKPRNAGKPIGAARGEVGAAANCFEYYGGAVDKVAGQTLPVAARGHAVPFPG